MSKKEVQATLKKGKAQFMLIGKAKITDYTYTIDHEYDSGWTDNQLNLGIDCGNGNVVYTELKGGYFPQNDSLIYVHGTKEVDGIKQEDYNNRFTIAWEDRFDKSILETVGDSCFIKVGIEKDTHDKTFTKKFISPYDAVAYIQEHLTDGTVLNVKGNLEYQPNNDFESNDVYLHKSITSIFLSKVKDEKDYKAKFIQTILLDSNSIGKKDVEHNTVGVSAYVVDYVGKVKIDNEKVKIGKNVTFPYNFELQVNDEKPEITAKMLQKFFKVVKKTDITELTVEGNIIEGQAIVNVTEDDIPDDIKELIEMGIYTQEEAETKCAIGNKNREKRLVITRPYITYVGKNEERKPTIAINTTKYKDSDKVFYSQLIAEIDKSDSKETNSENKSGEMIDNPTTDEDEDLLAMLEAVK